MRLLLPDLVLDLLQEELRRAGRREIGGVLVGEHLEGERFRIADISVQRTGGSSAHFVRDPAHHRKFLDDFFARTGYDYGRFNYIGEWHSHPHFSAIPSPTDCETMMQIVSDPAVDTAFAILIVATLRIWRGLELSATGFRPGMLPDPIELEHVQGQKRQKRFRQIKLQPRRKLNWI